MVRQDEVFYQILDTQAVTKPPVATVPASPPAATP
jgi:hypothetical protein